MNIAARALLAGARRAGSASVRLQRGQAGRRGAAKGAIWRRRFSGTPPKADASTGPVPGAAYESSSARQAALGAFREADPSARRKYADAVAEAVAKHSKASMSEKDAAAAAAAVAAGGGTGAGTAATRGAAIAGAVVLGAMGSAVGYSQYRRSQGDTRAFSTIVVDDLLGGRDWFLGGAGAFCGGGGGRG